MRVASSSIISSTCFLCNKIHLPLCYKILEIATMFSLEVLMKIHFQLMIIINIDNQKYVCSELRKIVKDWVMCVLLVIPNWWNTHLNSPNHALGDCFNLYKDFFNWHTSSLSLWTVKLGDCSMYTSFTKFPWRKCFWFVVDEATTRL